MTTFPLPAISVEQAKKLQFHIVDTIMHHFDGDEILSTGDLGVHKGLNRPVTTSRAEKVIAELFSVPDATLLRGAGTGALRWGLHAIFQHGGALLIHTSPVYPTTQVSLDMMKIPVVRADFNDPHQLETVIAQHPELTGALVQLTRQKPDDSYDYADVIARIKKANPAIRVLTDDNYAVMKVEQIGVQCGADLSSFSCFKLLGPEGVGALVGDAELVQFVRECNYSGGSQVQGHEAMETLRGFVYAPVALAIQAEVNDELVRRLNGGELAGVNQAFLANAQSKVLLVEFEHDIAEEVLAYTTRHGAAANPVGCESKYEVVPMMYRISGTFRKQDPTLEKRMIRINPMRGGPDTVIRILKQALEEINNSER